jgi:hypothetical protein
MISPSPIEQHVEIARAFGSRTQPLDSFARRGVLRRLRRRAAAAPDGIDAPITIRPASAKDARAIARLALLDGTHLPEGQRVLAEAGGHLLAATDVATGRTVADPFVPSAGVATLLRLRAEQIRPRAMAH